MLSHLTIFLRKFHTIKYLGIFGLSWLLILIIIYGFNTFSNFISRLLLSIFRQYAVVSFDPFSILMFALNVLFTFSSYVSFLAAITLLLSSVKIILRISSILIMNHTHNVTFFNIIYPIQFQLS